MALMEFQRSGREPECRSAEKTPLWTCLAAIPPRLRIHIKGVKLSPNLGYSTSQQFHTAEQLFEYLGGDNAKLIGNRILPSESYIDRRFNRPVDVESLLSASASYPPVETFTMYGIRIDPLKINSKSESEQLAPSSAAKSVDRPQSSVLKPK